MMRFFAVPDRCCQENITEKRKAPVVLTLIFKK
jgi:hypothetical protein